MEKILIDTVNTIKRYPILIAPALIASLIILILTTTLIGTEIDNLAQSTPEISKKEEFQLETMKILKLIVPAAGINYLLNVYAFSITIFLSGKALAGKQPNLTEAIVYIFSRTPGIIVMSIIIGIIQTVAAFMLVIPFFIVTYYLMFSFLVLLAENTNPITAIMRSIFYVKKNYQLVLPLYSLIIASALFTFIVNINFAAFRYVGIILTTVMASLFIVFISLLITRVYMEIKQVERMKDA